MTLNRVLSLIVLVFSVSPDWARAQSNEFIAGGIAGDAADAPGGPVSGSSFYKTIFGCFPDGYPQPPRTVCECLHPQEGTVPGLPFLDPPYYPDPTAKGDCNHQSLISRGYKCKAVKMVPGFNWCRFVRSLFTDDVLGDIYGLPCPRGQRPARINPDPYTIRSNREGENACPKDSQVFCSVTYTYDCVVEH